MFRASGFGWTTYYCKSEGGYMALSGGCSRRSQAMKTLHDELATLADTRLATTKDALDEVEGG